MSWLAHIYHNVINWPERTETITVIINTSDAQLRLFNQFLLYIQSFLQLRTGMLKKQTERVEKLRKHSNKLFEWDHNNNFTSCTLRQILISGWNLWQEWSLDWVVPASCPTTWRHKAPRLGLRGHHIFLSLRVQFPTADLS